MDRTSYMYRVTDNLNGKWYVGINTSKGCKPERLGVSYFTSSTIVKPLFKSNHSRFTKEILVIGDVEYIVELESKFLSKIDAKNDMMSYNMHNGNGKMNTVKSGELTSARMKQEEKGFFSKECKAKLKLITSNNGKRLAEEKRGAHSPEIRAKIKDIGKITGADNVLLKRGIFSAKHDRTKRTEPWWYNPKTGVTKRSFTQPSGFVKGRGGIKSQNL